MNYQKQFRDINDWTHALVSATRRKRYDVLKNLLDIKAKTDENGKQYLEMRKGTKIKFSNNQMYLVINLIESYQEILKHIDHGQY